MAPKDVVNCNLSNVILCMYSECCITCFQMFTSVRVVRLSNVNLTNQGLNKIFTDLCENLLKVRVRVSYLPYVLYSYIINQVFYLWLLQSFYFKLRSMIPCCLCHLNFTVAVPEEELVQVKASRDLQNKWVQAKMQNFLTMAVSHCLPGSSYCGGHDIWQKPGPGEATR